MTVLYVSKMQAYIPLDLTVTGDIGGLGGEMSKQLQTEKSAIQAKVDGRAKQVPNP